MAVLSSARSEATKPPPFATDAKPMAELACKLCRGAKEEDHRSKGDLEKVKRKLLGRSCDGGVVSRSERSDQVPLLQRGI